MRLFELFYEYGALAFIFWLIVFVLVNHDKFYLIYSDVLVKFKICERREFFVEGFLLYGLAKAFLYATFTVYFILVCEAILVVGKYFL